MTPLGHLPLDVLREHRIFFADSPGIKDPAAYLCNGSEKTAFVHGVVRWGSILELDA